MPEADVKDAPVPVFLALGSNLGDRVGNLRFAIERIASDHAMAVDDVSSVYETEPVGYEDQPRFLNMVIRAACAHPPNALLGVLQGVEEERGRMRSFRNAPRHLDIDLLLYGDRCIDSPGLTVPHPRMTDRGFVLVPLLELAPDLTEPGTAAPYRDYLHSGLSGGRRVLSADELLKGVRA